METKSFNKEVVISNGVLLNNEYVFSEIHKTIEKLIITYARPNSMNAKLGFISAILRDLNVKSIGGEQKFLGANINHQYENFQFNILMEHKNTEIKKSTYFINQEKPTSQQCEEFDEELAEEETIIKTFPILSQKDNLLSLFGKLSKITNHFDAAVNLTALLGIEFEMMSEKKLKRFLIYNEMYEIKNPLDKWICAVEIKAQYDKNYYPIGINQSFYH